MAVAAGHAFGEHAALYERAVFVDLAANLAVVVIEIFVEESHAIIVPERLAVNGVFVQDTSSGMTSPAHLNLHGGCAWTAATRFAADDVARPCDALSLVQFENESLVRRARLVFAPLRPRDVARARAVTRFASDGHLGVGRREGPRGVVVGFADVGGMAVGAHAIPVFRQPGPMKLVAGSDFFRRIQMKPSLAAFGARAAVPRYLERLKPPPGKRNEILLQGRNAERVGNLVFVERAVRTVGLDQERVTAAKEPRLDSRVA